MSGVNLNIVRITTCERLLPRLIEQLLPARS
jgi:hypothetical protein